MNHFIGLFIPLIITNILHMVVVKKDVYPGLKIPINKKLFGQNKTWRGILFVTVVNGFIHYLVNDLTTHSLMLGMIYGLAYTLSELPNSFIKRKLNIRPGESSPKYKHLQMILDKSDSAFGVTLVFCLLEAGSLQLFFTIFLIAAFLHFFFSYLIYKIGLKASL